MLPFHLAGRALFGGFDPRVVTLLFYALVIALAARFPASVDGRLCAAGIAALNPLVYWHQIFGANDLVFVAMILGAVLLAREPRPSRLRPRSSASPAPPSSWPGPSRRSSSWRCAGPAPSATSRAPRRGGASSGPSAAAAAVFVAVVVPVAALDFRAFWGDIVVYNVGLPGGDNYPLGGTPGFGFANYLLYFGRVADLRDYFPFSVFYALLVPLGFLLLRAQLRDGHPEWALATGSTALVASLYFSRVVHPNYLIPAAVVLPLAVLARRRGADVALAPLFLLALAVEMAEGATLPDGVGAGGRRRPARAARGPGGGARSEGGPVAHEGPAGASLQRDRRRLRGAVPGARRLRRSPSPPAGGHGGGGGPRDRRARPRPRGDRQPHRRRARAGPGRRAGGGRRGTAPRAAQPLHAASRDLPSRAPGRLRELPAGPAGGDPPVAAAPPAGAVRARRPRPGDRGAGPAARGRPRARRPRRRGRGRIRGAAAQSGARARAARGAAGARDRARIARRPVPGRARGRVGRRPARRRPGRRAAGRRGRRLSTTARRSSSPSWCLPPGVGGPSGGGSPALSSRTCWWSLPWRSSTPAPSSSRLGERAAPGPGLGLFNLLAYRGAEASAGALALAALAPLLSLGIVLWLLRRPWPPLALAGIASLVGIVLAPAVSAEAVAVPLVLLGLAAMEPGGEPAPRDRRTGKRPPLSTSGADPAGLVPEAGLEPARISPHAPQTCVSANSTTPARGRRTSRATNPMRRSAGCQRTAGRTRRHAAGPAEVYTRRYAPEALHSRARRCGRGRGSSPTTRGRRC